MVKVIKRNGNIVDFDRNKIINAINGAFNEVDGKPNDSLSASIATIVEEHGDNLNVEDIQDMVEDALMDSNRKDVARAYIRYRYKKEVAREKKDDFIEAIKEKLFAEDVKNQNANVDEKSFGGRLGEMSEVVTRKLALDEIISDIARYNHENNLVYIHDLGHYILGDHNCITIPFDKLLAEGFTTRQTDIRPANSINTAFQLIAVIFQLQSLCQFGGVSASHLDWTLVPYVRKSFYKYYLDGLFYCESIDELEYSKVIQYIISNKKEFFEKSIEDPAYKKYESTYAYAMNMLEREIRQGAEGLFHNLCSLQSRSGNQLPFTSINYGTCTLPEGRMIIKSLLEAAIDGIGKLHKTPIFPCVIFQLGKGINREPGDPNYDLYQLALESTSKRLYPNYANIDWSGNEGYDKNDPRTYFSTMGKCKL